jgi:TM2 domain-containing membrane protein YozV
MDQSKIDMFIATNSNKFPAEKLMLVKSQLEKLDDNKFVMVQSLNLKDPTTVLIFSIFLGSWGVDRFLLGQTGLGIAKLLTCGGLGIWTIVDWFQVLGITREENFKKFTQFAI